MQFVHTSPKTKGRLFFIHQEPTAIHQFQGKIENQSFLTIAMNSGDSQQIKINGVYYEFPKHSIIPLVSSQVFEFECSKQLSVWQYTRDFYCLIDNYFEISCLGLLFFGFNGNLFLKLDEDTRNKLQGLQQMFVEEFETIDTIQSDMLQMLLKRLIIITTRLAKEQYLSGKIYEEEKFDLIRQFNLLVDQHYKQEHQVQFYADLMNRSPKTLTNLFANFNYNPPSVVIQDRIIVEAKRLFYYTNGSVKEISHELGFSDAAHFSRFFKNATQLNPSRFKKTKGAIEDKL